MASQNHLASLPLELHTHIFSNLKPHDILQVHQTCKALYLASSQRVVWTGALHRFCVENTLFEPSFPVESMSPLELKRASIMDSHRWIAKSSKERDSSGILPHSVTRHPMSTMMSTLPGLSIAFIWSLHVDYLVPGGRYLFSLSHEWLVLWDLGSPYFSGREPHGVAAVSVSMRPRSSDHHFVHSTPDGTGLRVFLIHDSIEEMEMPSFDIYEIYPESTSPELTQIAYAQAPGSGTLGDYGFTLSYNRFIFVQGNTMTVWDYKANTWARWGADAEYIRIIATKFAVMLIHHRGVSVWEIPPLLPKSSLSMSTDPSVMSPVFELHYPENQFYGEHRQAPCDWYSGTQPLYYDVQVKKGRDSDTINRFEVAINSKISGGTLNLLKSFEVPTDYYSSVPKRIYQDKGYSLENRDDVTFCPATSKVVYYETKTHNFVVLEF